LLFQLAVSMPGTDETGSGLWRTPDASITTGGAANAVDRKAQGHAIGLHDQVNTPSMWPTPEGMAGGKTSRGGKRKNELLLGGMVKLWPTCHGFSKDGKSNGPSGNELGRAVNRSLWPTPQASYPGQGDPTDPKRGKKLQNMAKLWPTPRLNDYKGSGPVGSKSHTHMADLGKVVGPTKASGSLNPAWVEWLMGYPDGWTALEDSAMPSSRKSRSKSCAPSPQSKEAE
jgi:hypothetical protein